MNRQKTNGKKRRPSLPVVDSSMSATKSCAVSAMPCRRPGTRARWREPTIMTSEIGATESSM